MSFPLPKPFRSGPIAVGPGSPLLVIAGLCILEELESSLRHAEILAEELAGLPIGLVFKASYDKANRSSIKSYRGPGLEEGLAILGQIKRKTGLPILTDVHESAHCAPAAAVADILQIPAFLCRQTDLLVAAAQSGRMINVKKGQFLAPRDMAGVVGKLKEAGAKHISICERGSSFGYNTLVNDFRALPEMRAMGTPVVFDATHSVQQPGGLGATSGGDRRMVPYLARAAVAAGVDGVFFEVHENPEKARSDGPNSLQIHTLKDLVKQLLSIREALGPEPWDTLPN